MKRFLFFFILCTKFGFASQALANCTLKAKMFEDSQCKVIPNGSLSNHPHCELQNSGSCTFTILCKVQGADYCYQITDSGLGQQKTPSSPLKCPLGSTYVIDPMGNNADHCVAVVTQENRSINLPRH